jgi:hypothetical protein
LNQRRHQTFADYAAVALCPSLIVLLISSLVYFVVMCVYRGGYSGRIGYIWFMFILGAVAIARLSIQESRKYAMGYAAVLGIATFFVLSRFMTVQGSLAGLSPIINGLMIAMVWFLADRITFDCTLIDEDADASGRGLLDGLTDEGPGDQDAKQHATRKRGHQPGKTVLWLTAAALPIFGLGQTMLPDGERWQGSAMMALAVYLFATLSLLIATSFLGVRRYLRQRGVDMPANVSVAWLVGGIVMTVLMLLACFLLPQPGTMLANAELPQSLESPDWLKPSKYGWGGETAEPDPESSDAATALPQESAEQPGDKPGQPSDSDAGKSSGEPGGTKPGEKGSPSDQGKKTAGADGEKGEKGEGEKGNDGKSGDDKSDKKESGDNKGKSQSNTKGEATKTPDEPSESPSDDPSQKGNDPKDSPSEASQKKQQADAPQETPPTSSDTSSAFSDLLPSLGTLLRGLIYLVLIGVLLAFAWFQRHEIAKAWQAFLAWLRGEGVADELPNEVRNRRAPEKVYLPFSAFRNPLGGRVEPREAVIVTYQAAEAWWRERGQPRRPEETPSEYSRRLRPENKSDHEALLRLTEAYNRIVYGDDTVQPPDLAAAAAVWKSFVNS